MNGASMAARVPLADSSVGSKIGSTGHEEDPRNEPNRTGHEYGRLDRLMEVYCRQEQNEADGKQENSQGLQDDVEPGRKLGPESRNTTAAMGAHFRIRRVGRTARRTVDPPS